MTVYKVAELRGATPWLTAMLRGNGIEDSGALLAACGPVAGRAALAEELTWRLFGKGMGGRAGNGAGTAYGTHQRVPHGRSDFR